MTLVKWLTRIHVELIFCPITVNSNRGSKTKGDGGWGMGDGGGGRGLLSETSSQLLDEILLDKDIVLVCKHSKTQTGSFSAVSCNKRRSKICLCSYVRKKT